MSLSRDHAEALQRSRTHKRIATTVSEQIPCSLSKTGQHPLTFSLNEAGVLVRLETPCIYYREEYAALQRLGHPCCLTTLDWIRERLNGDKHWEYRDEPPNVSRWLKDLLRGAWDRAYYMRGVHSVVGAPTSMQDERRALLQTRIDRYGTKPFVVEWVHDTGLSFGPAWVLKLHATTVAALVGRSWVVFEAALDTVAQHINSERKGKCVACGKTYKNLWVHNRSDRHKANVRILLQKTMSVFTKDPHCFARTTPEIHYADTGVYKMESLAHEIIGDRHAVAG